MSALSCQYGCVWGSVSADVVSVWVGVGECQSGCVCQLHCVCASLIVCVCVCASLIVCVCVCQPHCVCVCVSLKPKKFVERSHIGAQMLCSSFSPGGMFVATGNSDYVIRVYFLFASEPNKICELEAHSVSLLVSVCVSACIYMRTCS